MSHKAFVDAFFAFEHLPPHLQAVSAPFAALARTLVATHTAQLEAVAEADSEECAACLRAVPGSHDRYRERAPLRREADRLAGAEIAVALRKLREAKDCAVLAAVVLAKVTP